MPSVETTTPDRPIPSMPPVPREPLFRAAYLGEDDVLKRLLDEGASPNKQDKAYHGTTLLQYAAIGGRIPTVALLIERGASLDKRGLYSIPPLVAALWFRRYDVVNVLIERGANIEITDERGERPLMCAAESSDLRPLVSLIDAGATIDAIDTVDDDPTGGTALHRAARWGRSRAVERLLDAGALPDRIHPGSGRHALCMAAMKGQMSVVRQLLAAGSDIDLRDKQGSSALTWSLFENHGETSAELLACGAQVGLAEAVLLNDAARVMDLLDSGRDPNTRACWGSSLLASAAERGFRECVSLLLNAGATVNDPESNALSYAAAKGDNEMVALLLDAGAEINFSAEEGDTPLMIATLVGHESTVALLLERGADPFATDHYARSAAYYADPAIVEIFSRYHKKPGNRTGPLHRLLDKLRGR